MNQKVMFLIQKIPLSIILAVILLVIFRDVIFFGRSFSPSTTDEHTRYYYADAKAISQAVEPFSRFALENIHQGKLPLWNPHQGLGAPFHGDGIASLFDPLMWIVYLAPSSLWLAAFDFQLLIRYFLAGYFSLLFMQALGVNRPGRLLTSIGFVLCTYFMTQGNIIYARTELYIPLLFYATHRLATSPSAKWFVFLAFSLLLTLLSGFPEIYPLFIVQIGLYYSFQISQQIKLLKPVSISHHVLKSMVLLILALSLAFMLASVEILPFIDYFFQAHTRGVEGKFQFNIIAYASRMNPVIVFLALFGGTVALVRKAEWRSVILYFLGMALFMTAVIFRFPGFNLVYHIPIINLIYLERNLEPYVMFSLAVAGGLGLQIWAEERPVFQLIISSKWWFLGFILLYMFLSVQPLYMWISLFFTFFVLVILPILSNFFATKNIVPWIVILALLVAATSDLGTMRGPRYDLFSEPPYVTFLKQQGQDVRIMGLDNYLRPDTAMALGLDDVRFLEALFPPTFMDFSSQLLYKPNNTVRFTGKESLYQGIGYDISGVTHLIAAKDNNLEQYSQFKQWELIYEDQEVNIYKNPTALPRAYVVTNVLVATDYTDAIKQIQNPAFNSHTTAVVQGENIPFVLNKPQPVLPIPILSRSANQIQLEVNLNEPGLLVVLDQYFSGWNVEIDGETGTIYPVNGVMRGVYLPAGEHTINFLYYPSSYKLGIIISLSSMIVLAFIVLFQLPVVRKTLRRLRLIHAQQK